MYDISTVLSGALFTEHVCRYEDAAQDIIAMLETLIFLPKELESIDLQTVNPSHELYQACIIPSLSPEDDALQYVFFAHAKAAHVEN